MNHEDAIMATVAKRTRWAQVALATAAAELRELDSERARAFAEEAGRVAGLMDAPTPSVSRRGAWA
jgi:hypothetical protein